MPAPSTIITFTDADGDEFPVRIFVTADADDHDRRKEIIAAAENDLRAMMDSDDLRPTMPVKVSKVEKI